MAIFANFRYFLPYFWGVFGGVSGGLCESGGLLDGDRVGSGLAVGADGDGAAARFCFGADLPMPGADAGTVGCGCADTSGSAGRAAGGGIG